MDPYYPSEENEEGGFFKRYGLAVGIGAALVAAGVTFVAKSFARATAAPHRMAEVTMVKLIATPPPPPPPPPPQPKLVEEKMVEQMPVDNAEAKPDDSPASPSADLGTSITGNGGPDAFGLSGNRGSGVLGGSGARGSGSRWGWYAAQVQGAVSEALRQNPRTRDASFRIEVRIWPDLTGRVTRATLVTSTGDAAVDAALKTEVLTGLQLTEPPPQGMPLPIVMRLTARRPN